MLRNDDPRSRDAFRILANNQVACTNLVPLIRSYSTDAELVYNAREFITLNCGGACE